MDIRLIRKSEPLSKHCTFRVGGFAKYFYEVENTDDIPDLVKWAYKEKIPFFIFSGGSNVLFKDIGFEGLVLKITASQITVGKTQITAEAGAKLAQVVKTACENNLGGIEEFISIPGSVGGAVRGNAGCFGKEISSVLKNAWILKAGRVQKVGKDYFHFAYRYSSLKDTHEILLKASFSVHKGCDKKRMKEVLAGRKGKQPWGLSAGSFFKNPGQSAGALIEQCGLKGHVFGGAQISEKHANFIMNLGSAKASDILALAKMAQDAVKTKFDIDLQPEVQIVG
ncbi:MAG: UDP-N-acetylmuramate dehydrogenase [Candidatus Gracilibacteria bacterium]|jgi:UDP-N-acetylmuramate dehydrogenase